MSSTLHPKFSAYGPGAQNFGTTEHNFSEVKLKMTGKSSHRTKSQYNAKVRDGKLLFNSID